MTIETEAERVRGLVTTPAGMVFVAACLGFDFLAIIGARDIVPTSYIVARVLVVVFPMAAIAAAYYLPRDLLAWSFTRGLLIGFVTMLSSIFLSIALGQAGGFELLGLFGAGLTINAAFAAFGGVALYFRHGTGGRTADPEDRLLK